MNPPAPPFLPPESPRRLFIVEDNPALRAALAAEARRCGLFSSVTTAEDGRDALKQLTDAAEGDPSGLPEVVVTDLYMPNLNGVELVCALRRLPALDVARRIVISEWDGPEERNAAHLAGCHAFFKKPAAGKSLAVLLCAVAVAGDKPIHYPAYEPVERLIAG